MTDSNDAGKSIGPPTFPPRSATDSNDPGDSAAGTVESRARLAMELAEIGVITVDYRDQTARLDHRAADLFDLPADRRVDRQAVHRRFHSEDYERIMTLVERACEDPSIDTVQLEHRIVTRDGDIRWVDICKKVAFDPATDAPVGSTVAVLDVTRQKAYETEMDDARRVAEDANRVRGEFLASMSHEIRTPMTAMLGFADVLADRLTDPDDLRCVETIRRNGRYLLNIINDILDLSKIDAGKIEPMPTPVWPESLLADVVSLMSVRSAERDLELTAAFATDVPRTIRVDAGRLKQVLVNLVGNAIKFTERGGVAITCGYDADLGEIRFDVTDTGVGIEEADLQRMFEPFTQAVDAGSSGEGGGVNASSGLGLAISRRLAEALGGRLTVTSHRGEGSRFTVAVPAGAGADVPLVRPKVDSTPRRSVDPETRFAGRCVVVDDREEIRFLSTRLIEAAGGRVWEAGDGAAAIELIERLRDEGEKIDVVLMDMEMPGMNGYAAAAELRRRGCDVPIVALTANAMADDRQRCLDAGCTEFLSKPIDRASLMRTLAALVGKRHADVGR